MIPTNEITMRDGVKILYDANSHIIRIGTTDISPEFFTMLNDLADNGEMGVFTRDSDSGITIERVEQ